MIFNYFMLFVALSISMTSAYYSIIGLTAIFAASFWPIVVMGSVLELGKIASSLWLKLYWNIASPLIKLYLSIAVVLLIFITSIGVFGFLSKAHLDQTVPTGDVSAQVALLDEKIKTQRDNIDAARKALLQMDNQVNARLDRSDDEKGAERAIQIRRQQAKERQVLQTEIATAQKSIGQLNEERAPIASQLRKVEAEVGPIRYIAALIYGDNPDANLLERAVRWVIIILVLVFDPLAVSMLLAFTESWRWEKDRRRAKDPPPEKSNPEPIVPTTTPVVFPPAPEIPTPEPVVEQTPTPLPEPEPVVEPEYDEDEELESLETNPRIKEAMKLWKSQNHTRTLKGERQRHRQGLIDSLPWMALLDQLPRDPSQGFGQEFPQHPIKGDSWLRTDIVPNGAYKFNGDNWIVVDKYLNSSYTYNEAYIDHLIGEIDAGRYDPDMLTPSEAEQIEQRLRI